MQGVKGSTPSCSIIGCDRIASGRGWCSAHYTRFLKYGDPIAPMRRAANGAGGLNGSGYLVRTEGNRRRREHIIIAERALGKPLPDGAVVHHVNQIRTDNRPGNLVICPDAAYHSLIHMRMKARDARKPLHFRKCQLCQQWDEPANLRFVNDGGCYHNACRAAYELTRKRRASPHKTWAPRTKIDRRDAVTIREARNAGESMQALAVRFGIHASHVSRICSGKVWGDA